MVSPHIEAAREETRSKERVRRESKNRLCRRVVIREMCRGLAISVESSDMDQGAWVPRFRCSCNACEKLAGRVAFRRKRSHAKWFLARGGVDDNELLARAVRLP